jgi:hypothetical protein
MQVIKDWLKGGQSYDVGVRLYMRYGRDKQLQRLFTSEGPSDFKRKKLASALKEIAELGEAKPPPMKAITVSVDTTQANFIKSWPEPTKDDEAKLLWHEARLLLKEIAEIHGKLDVVPSDEERRKLAFQLLRKDEELDQVYVKRDFFLKHQKMPVEALPFIPITDPHLLAKRLANLQRYVRREKLAIDKDETNEQAKGRLAVFEAELNYYKEKTGDI